MKIKVEKQTKQFFLAKSSVWQKAVGHQINVGEYKFCAIPLSECINISEVTSGAKILELPMTPEIYEATQTKEDAIFLFSKVGKSLERIINSSKNFQKQIDEIKEQAESKLGKRPPVENYDIDWIFAPENDHLN